MAIGCFIAGEVVRMFRPYQAPHQRRPHPPRRTPKTQSFTHRFFCLTGRRQEEVPNPSERFLLERAGLREKKITFPGKSTKHYVQTVEFGGTYCCFNFLELLS